MAYHILLVDDAPELRRMVGELLEGAGYAVTLAADCAQARAAWARQRPDAALLDVMLPDGDGFALLGELRRDGGDVPVLFLSARDEDEARLQGLGLGADDYITKPFSPSELTARVDAIHRRVTMMTGRAASGDIVSGPFVLNQRSRTLTKNGKLIDLTQVEFQIMELFLKNPNVALERSEILSKVWGENYFGDVKIVDVNVRRLRMKIEDEPSSPKYLCTVWGYGYKWTEE